MSEYIFVNLIDKQTVGSDLGQSIPFHMTALHWFETERSAEDIINAADFALRSLSRVLVHITEEDKFGPDKDIPVMRLEKTPEILRLHCSLLETMEDLEVTLDKRWVGSSRWNPHVTIKPNRKLSVGDVVEIQDIDLISRSEETGNRKIIHRFKLN